MLREYRPTSSSLSLWLLNLWQEQVLQINEQYISKRTQFAANINVDAPITSTPKLDPGAHYTTAIRASWPVDRYTSST